MLKVTRPPATASPSHLCGQTAPACSDVFSGSHTDGGRLVLGFRAGGHALGVTLCVGPAGGQARVPFPRRPVVLPVQTDRAQGPDDEQKQPVQKPLLKRPEGLAREALRRCLLGTYHQVTLVCQVKKFNFEFLKS